MSHIVIENDNTWRLSGELSFATVGALLTEFSQRAALKPPKVLDLYDVTRTDSAGLALLIELRGQTKEAPMNFRNIPEQMFKLAALSGVELMIND
ncbi:MAG: anti-anti-sigma factor [Gammaproteobacteria bacterium]|nr:MAG: anti-anti-sigma factor [Gammaproteobacteria bacterium]RKZ36187.1 MAG: anti-anti-sigma factor [Gammaproteobacteria bacterium]RKZ73161.1 MAG: anti-anti-sigma factor [Gammaproteobacteria bacterium]